MEINRIKGSNTELLIDWNGHPVQCFPTGGSTLEIGVDDSLKTACSLIRIANIGTETGFFKKSSLGASDPGIPIPAGTAEMLAIEPGEIYVVLGSPLYVTVINNRNV